MIGSWIFVFLVSCAVFLKCQCQEYDFAAEITRQCLVPDPVGLLDCVENKVTLPYLTSWVDCTNSLGENVKTSADIINYRCKSVWEGKGVIPEVFYIKDCVIEKTGLPAKNVSAEVLGAYKECESTPSSQQQRTKTAPVQQQQMKTSFVEYKPPTQQTQTPVVQPQQQTIQARAPVQQVRNQLVQPQIQIPFQQPQAPLFQPPQQQVQMTFQQAQAPMVRPPQQLMQMQMPFQQSQPSVFSQPQNVRRQQLMSPRVPQFQPQQFVSVQRPAQQQIQVAAPRPIQQQIQTIAPRPMQQQIQAVAPYPVQQAPTRSFAPLQQVQVRPVQISQGPTSSGPQYPSTVSGSANPYQRQPQSQQYFAIYPQAPLANQQQNANQAVSSRKTATSPVFMQQQQVAASAQQSSYLNLKPYSYSVQINHPFRSSF